MQSPLAFTNGTLFKVSSTTKTSMRQKLSYCLYILDKAICWTAGSSPSVPSSDIFIDTAAISSRDDVMTNLVAKVELAKIEETIYCEMYASQATPISEDQVRQIVSVTIRRLENWLADSKINLDEMEKDSESTAPGIEMAVAFLCAQLLLLWPFEAHVDLEFGQSQEIAKKCMRLLLLLWRSAPDQERYANLPQSVLINFCYHCRQFRRDTKIK